jgi:hypothetical protein
VTDAESFGQACADVWFRLQDRKMQQESSIGALVEHLDDAVIEQLDGACISLTRA